MAVPTPLTLHAALQRLAAEVGRDQRLASEMARARREFFGPAPDARDPAAMTAAGARFTEWYLLERDSEILGDTPARSALFAVELRSAEQRMLLNSTMGVFLVESVDDQLTRLVDLQGRQAHDLQTSPFLPLAIGDVLVGRLFLDAQGVGVPSAAIAVRPAGEDLATAFAQDLETLSLGRRLSQVEIEHLLFRRPAVPEPVPPRPIERLEAELDELLARAGVETIDLAAISTELAQAESLGVIVGPLLDQIAFETDLDLGHVQRLLVELWTAYHPATRPSTAAPRDDPPPAFHHPGADATADADETALGLGARLAQRIERGRERAEDLERVFQDCAEMLGEDIDTDEDGEAEAGVAAYEGDLAALVQEFVWEEGCSGSDDERWLQELERQQRDAPVPRLELEYLEANDLLRLLLRVYLESPPVARADAVRRAWAALERFYAWAERTQCYALSHVITACRHAFVDQLERVHAASLALSAGTSDEPPPRDARATLLRVMAVTADGIEVDAGHGGEPLLLAAGDRAQVLREGDLLLAALRHQGHGSARLGGMVVVLPPGAEPLLGG